MTNTLFDNSRGNSSLRAEKSTSLTAGFDADLEALPGLTFSATYFNLSYRDRIDAPPTQGELFGIFAREAVLAPSLIRSPSHADVQAAYDNPGFIDVFGIPADAVAASFDNRLQNIARSRTRGVDFSAAYRLERDLNQFSLYAGGTRLLHSSYRAAPGSEAAPQAGVIFTPTKLRLNAGATWERKASSATIIINHIGGLKNNLVTPSRRVSSFTTFDLQASYKFQEAFHFLSGTTISVSIRNLLNTDSPRTRFDDGDTLNYGFDPTNASPIGRFAALQIKKAW